jgi:hypothetical protein
MRWFQFNSGSDNNLFYSDLTAGWLMGPAFRILGAYAQSVKQYPNIKVGEDFKGYKK